MEREIGVCVDVVVVTVTSTQLERFQYTVAVVEIVVHVVVDNVGTYIIHVVQ